MFSISRFMSGFFKKIVTLGPIGNIKGSGTLATFCSIPLIYFASSSIFFTGLLIVFLFSATAQTVSLFQKDDPAEIVSDEVIGFAVAMFGIKKSGIAYVVGFFLFRFFDISKVCGIKRAESLPGSIGIVMDDVIAGLYTNFLLRLGLWLLL